MALSSRQINAVQLVAKHLHRIAQYDRRGPRLNSIPVLNLDVFEEAQASDELRAQGTVRSPLEGIPYTVKDSFMMKGLTVASGSPAFANLTATHDAFTVGLIRNAGGIGIGKTNMPPMANGGMQRGLYGRAESPYNKNFLTAAHGSGSSNGAGTSTASSMAIFGMAEESVSSGRSPASNNGLVAYTPSRGVLSIRGNWPLIPAGDVVVPFTRSVKDLMTLLDIIAVTDNDTTCDFWRDQLFVPLPVVEDTRPESYLSLADADSLRGKRIGVPKVFIDEFDPAAVKSYLRPSIRELHDKAVLTLESLGAIVEEVDFPMVTNHEVPATRIEVVTDYPIPSYYNGSSGPAELSAYSWDDFLAMNNDTTNVLTLADVDPTLIFPQLPGTLIDRGGNVQNERLPGYVRRVEYAQTRNGTAINDLPGLGPWLKDVEARRQRDLNDWMDERGLDLLVWPANGDAAPQDTETEEMAARLGWRNGVSRSKGNYAIRQYGVPTVGVSMGAMNDIGMPCDLTFAGRPYDDTKLISYAYAFEQAQKEGARFNPPRTPELESDEIERKCVFRNPPEDMRPPKLEVEAVRTGNDTVEVSGRIVTETCGEQDVVVEVYVDGVSAGMVSLDGAEFSVTAPTVPSPGVSRFGEVNVPDISLAMVVVVATAPNRRSDGALLFV